MSGSWSLSYQWARFVWGSGSTNWSSSESLNQSVYEAKWTIFIKWCHSNQVNFRAKVADFLLNLFQPRKLQPSTVDGYRSAIADKLGNAPIYSSKDENLTCLLVSFHRDRHRGRRGIPSWNILLVETQNDFVWWASVANCISNCPIG